jgi:hypothetical protein
MSIWRHQAIGKESNAIVLMAAEETDGVVEGEEAGMTALRCSTSAVCRGCCSATASRSWRAQRGCRDERSIF